MKRGTTEHPKFRSLCQQLRLRTYEATGLLECLWQFTSRYARKGDVGRWKDDEIADFCGWPVERAGELMTALADTGWLDRCDQPDVRYLVHDWPEHADDSVHMALARAKQKFAGGALPRLNRLTKAEKENLQLFYSDPCAQNSAVCTQLVQAGSTTCDSPSKPDIKQNSSAIDSDPSAVFRDAWNALGPPFARIVQWTWKRKQAFKVRYADALFRTRWQEALSKVKASNFCRGGGSTGWVGDVEWFLRPGSLAKILEGKYDDRSGQQTQQGEMSFEDWEQNALDRVTRSIRSGHQDGSAGVPG